MVLLNTILCLFNRLVSLSQAALIYTRTVVPGYYGGELMFSVLLKCLSVTWYLQADNKMINSAARQETVKDDTEVERNVIFKQEYCNSFL